MHVRRPEWYAGNLPWIFAARAACSFSQTLLVIVVTLYVAAANYSTLQVGYQPSFALAGSTGMTILVASSLTGLHAQQTQTYNQI